MASVVVTARLCLGEVGLEGSWPLVSFSLLVAISGGHFYPALTIGPKRDFSSFVTGRRSRFVGR